MSWTQPERCGFSLIEVVLALGIAAFVLLVIIGLLTAGTRDAKAAADRFGAHQLAKLVAAELLSSGSNSGATPTLGLTPPPLSATNGAFTTPVYFDSDGNVSTVAQARSMVTVYYFIPPANSLLPKTANVTVTWPAQAAATNQSTFEFSFPFPL